MKKVNYEVFVSLEVAKLLKKAGFNWEVNHSYPDRDPLDNSCSGYMEDLPFYHNLNDGKYGGMSVPTLDVAQRWLREVKHLDVIVNRNLPIYEPQYSWDYEYVIITTDGRVEAVDCYFEEYEQAQEAGIKKALELILEKGE